MVQSAFGRSAQDVGNVLAGRGACEEDVMKRVRRVLMWVALVFIMMLILMSILGAFLGPTKAEAFFNSVPLIVYWVALALILAAGIALFPRLHRVPGLLLLHVGTVIVLAGSMWASNTGHDVQYNLFGTRKFKRGVMRIYEGSSENTVILSDKGNSAQLPFSIRLRDFRIEYYPIGSLFVKAPDKRVWRVPIEIGREFPLDPEYGSLTILRSFRNFRIDTEGEERIAFDDPSSGSNPALEVRIDLPGGASATEYVVERTLSHAHPGKRHNLKLSYVRMPRDFISELEVLEDNVLVAEKSIEANHPLHYGGYYFYQSDCGSDGRVYTILSVASDSGIYLIYVGYVTLMIGLVWHFWLKPVFSRIEIKPEKGETSGD